MRPEYHGAPPAKESKFKLFLPNRNATGNNSTPKKRVQPSEITPLLEATLADAKITESIANATMDVLEKQGERIDSASANTTSVLIAASESVQHIDTMSNREIRKRFMLKLVIVALFATIAALLIHHFFWNRRS